MLAKLQLNRFVFKFGVVKSLKALLYKKFLKNESKNKKTFFYKDKNEV